MTDKDTKDMTASELLREADSNPCSMCHLVMTGDESCATIGCASWAYRLADKIDAELAQARELSLLRGAELWAKANGWPDFREGEDFGAWLERCTYKKPVDDCNEPVQFGDEIELHSDGGDFYSGRFQEINISRGPVRLLSFTGVDHEHLRRYDTECDVIKRPAPEVLLGDGKPVSKGETAYDTKTGLEITVSRIAKDENGNVIVCANGDICELQFTPRDLTHEPPMKGADGKTIKVGETVYPIDGEWLGIPLEVSGIESPASVKVYLSAGKSWTTFHADRLTHTPPDTQAKIDADVKENPCAYFGRFICEGCHASENERSCDEIMILDLLRRQRELDARKGGE